MRKIGFVSGYFNPLHKGHIEYFQKAKSAVEHLVVIVNNDHQRALKGSKAFQSQDERLFIVKSIRYVNQAFLSVDSDRTVCKSLEELHTSFEKFYSFNGKKEYYFINGGDQNNESIPEKEICDRLGIILVDGMGDKVQSSSWLLKDE
jgi:cytidyltransferase-like protein